MKIETLSTFYIPEGSRRTVTFPQLRNGNEEGKVFLSNDRGTLFTPVYVEEADHDGLLLLKQYNAGELIGTLRTLIENDLLEWDQPIEIHRRDVGGYSVEPVIDEMPEDASDVM